MSNLGKKPSDDDEVEQLLRAAQDDMLLKLNVNSHMARGSASAAIDPDLDRRFLALKKPTKSDGSVKKVPKEVDSKAADASPEDDLFTRFAALKSSIPSHSGKEKSSNIPMDGSAVAEEDNDEDEVEKVIKWAIDAARLDPSPPSDNEDDDDRDHSDDTDDDDDSSGDDNDDDDDGDGVGRGKKSKRK